MSRNILAFVVVQVLFVTGCGPSRPTPAAGEEALKAGIREERPNMLKLVNFQKADGQAREIQGVKVYVLDFTANVQVLDDQMCESSNQSIKASVAGPALNDGRGFRWDAFFNTAVSGRRMVYQGDQFKLVGQVTFERKESGWVAAGVHFSSTLDISGRLSGHGPKIPPHKTIALAAPVGRWTDRVTLGGRSISCDDFPRNVLIQGEDETKTAVDGPTNRNWGPIAFGQNLKSIRFRAEGAEEVPVVCNVQ